MNRVNVNEHDTDRGEKDMCVCMREKKRPKNKDTESSDGKRLNSFRLLTLFKLF